MNLIIGILPAALRPYAKTVVTVLSVALAVAAQLVPFLPAGAANAVSGVALVLNALGVYATPNTSSEAPAGDEYSDGAPGDEGAE